MCAWLGHNFYTAADSKFSILLFGALGGALAGVIVALMLDFTSGRLTNWASARAQSLRGDPRDAIVKSV